jgi:hypothetical protein
MRILSAVIIGNLLQDMSNKGMRFLACSAVAVLPVPIANCQMVAGANGSISIYVPLSMVTVPGAIDAKLHEVTASTMTLPARGNSNPNIVGLGGVLFNLIDVVQGYVFDPNLVKAVSRKMHGGLGPFDINLPFSGTTGIECRQGQGPNSNNHQVVVTFAAPVSVTSAAVTGGTGSVSSTVVAGNEVTVNLAGVANEQTIGITLFGVNDGTGAANVVVPMSILAGDTNADKRINVGDTNQTRSRSGQLVNATNFRSDVNLDGRINVGDTNFVRSHSGEALGP